MDESAVLRVGGREYRLPVFEGTMGEKAIDISSLRKQSGYVTYDPGFANTGACSSAITYVDGERGILRYRGVPVEEFTKKPNFIEVAWWLIFGHRPSATEYRRFSERLTRNAHLHEGMRVNFESFPKDSPPMAMLSAMLNVLTCYHQDLLQIDDPESMEDAAARLMSKIRTVAAYSYRRSRGEPIIYPDPGLRYTANFLHMMFSQPYRQYPLVEEHVRALDLILILHADHEQNCSTTTVRAVGSSQANLFTCVASGVSALWGRRHGGANMDVMDTLAQILRGGLSVQQVIARVKNKTMLLPGFGHRVYKNYDPRAKVLRDFSQRLFGKIKRKDPLLDIAFRLEEAALKDPYFVDRNLYPNVDFYSGILMRELGIPTDMFTVIFAIGRLPGWIAHWREQHLESGSRIFRPRQIYTGEKLVHFTP